MHTWFFLHFMTLISCSDVIVPHISYSHYFLFSTRTDSAAIHFKWHIASLHFHIIPPSPCELLVACLVVAAAPATFFLLLIIAARVGGSQTEPLPWTYGTRSCSVEWGKKAALGLKLLWTMGGLPTKVNTQTTHSCPSPKHAYTLTSTHTQYRCSCVHTSYSSLAFRDSDLSGVWIFFFWIFFWGGGNVSPIFFSPPLNKFSLLIHSCS